MKWENLAFSEILEDRNCEFGIFIVVDRQKRNRTKRNREITSDGRCDKVDLLILETGSVFLDE